MTYEKALQILNSSFYPQDTVTTDYVNTLAKALKKQIPKKPIHKHFCPVCASTIDGVIYKGGILFSCPKCGQAIDWSETE